MKKNKKNKLSKGGIGLVTGLNIATNTFKEVAPEMTNMIKASKQPPNVNYEHPTGTYPHVGLPIGQSYHPGGGKKKKI